MEEPDVAMLAAAAGLDLALARFPDDVAAAIRSAAAGRQAVAGDLPPTVEPYPPLRPAAGS